MIVLSRMGYSQYDLTCCDISEIGISGKGLKPSNGDIATEIGIVNKEIAIGGSIKIRMEDHAEQTTLSTKCNQV